MTGSQLLKHSFGMIERNIGTAMRISLVLFLISLALQFGTSFWTTMNIEYVTGLGMGAFVAMTYLPSVVTIILGAWSAVAWHRFVLLEERPSGWLPQFHGREVLRYILWLLVLAVIYLVLLIPLILLMVPFVVGIEGGNQPGAGSFILIFLATSVMMMVVVVVLSRLSPVLVSRAVSNRLSLADAWRATRGSTKPIIGFMFIMLLFLLVFGVIVGLIIMVLKTIGLFLIIPLYMLFAWFLALLQISYMTTLYGHYVENRKLTL